MKFTLVYVLLLYSKRGLALLETNGYKTRCASASRAVHCQRSWPVATAGASSNEASSFSPGYLGSLLLDGYAPRDCNSSSHNLYDGGSLATVLLATMICQATAHWPSNLINMRRVSWRATMEAFFTPIFRNSACREGQFFNPFPTVDELCLSCTETLETGALMMCYSHHKVLVTVLVNRWP